MEEGVARDSAERRKREKRRGEERVSAKLIGLNTTTEGGEEESK